jgi:hypothetical protein
VRADVAAQEGIAFLGPGPVLAAYKACDLMVSARNRHPDPYAHGVIAEALRLALRKALDCAPRSGND